MKGCLFVFAILVLLAIIFGDNAWVAFLVIASLVAILALVFAISSIYKETEKAEKSDDKESDSQVDKQKEDDTKEKVAAIVTSLSETKSSEKEELSQKEPVVIKLSIIQFQGINESVQDGLELCRKISADDDLRSRFFEQAINSSTYSEYSAEDFFSTMRFLYANDLFDCFNHLGHNIENIAKTSTPVSINYSEPSGQALYATLSSLSETKTDYKSFRDGILALNNIHDDLYDTKIRQTIENMLPVYLDSGASIKAEGVDDFNIVLLLRTLDKNELIPKIRQIYYDFSNAVALSDKDLDGKERAWLDDLKGKIVSKSIPQQHIDNDVSDSADDSMEEKNTDNSIKAVENPIGQLNELVGLKQVKSELKTLTQFIEVNQKRREAGLRVASISYHCVFAGNPGTGKTTVARILAGIYKQLGILEKGQLIETDRSGLVAEYVGQTAVKTNKIIDKAIGGVLFIDEAYTLAQGSEQDYGKEAIATLLKRMEDDRDRLVVILAGYTNEIEQFINSNPGLRSRFNRYVHFEDYTEEELYQIFLMQAKKYDYKLNNEAEASLRHILREKVANKQKDFGNARYIRNLFEKVIENQAVRLSESQSIDKDSLAIITKDDIHE